MATQVLVEMNISVPPERVWSALRDPAQIANWFGWDTDTLADEIDFIFAKGAVNEVPNQRLDFGEWEGASSAYELEPAGGGTLLRVVRTGAPAPDYDEVVEGRISFTHQLRFWLERHAGAPRRSIYHSVKTGKALSSVLQLHGLHDARPDRPYVAVLPGGEPIEGTIWHRTKHQLGVTVKQWNDALLVLDREHGGSATISTHGLDDRQFAMIEAGWAARMAANDK